MILRLFPKAAAEGGNQLDGAPAAPAAPAAPPDQTLLQAWQTAPVGRPRRECQKGGENQPLAAKGKGGSKGGKSCSAAKVTAAKANGKKGGCPLTRPFNCPAAPARAAGTPRRALLLHAQGDQALSE